MLVIMIGVLIIVLQTVAVDVTIVGSDFDKVDQFDDKIGINHILVSIECISTCACGALCGQEGERCKSFFFYGEESLCQLYSEHLDNLQLNNKMGSKGYSVKHSSYSSVTSTTSPTAATSSSTTGGTMTSGNTAISVTDSIATSTSVTTSEPCPENSGEPASGCPSTNGGGSAAGTGGSSS